MANLLYRGPTTPTAGHAATLTTTVALTVDDINKNFFGLNLDVLSRTSRLGDTFSGNVLVSGTGLITLATSGDITAYRSGGTTGVIFLNNTGTKYLYNDGTNYQLPIQGLIVGGNIGAPGLSSSLGVTSGTNTGAFNAIMGVSSSATWLVSGTSGGVFRGGLQLLDSGGEMYLNVGGTNFSFTSTGIFRTGSIAATTAIMAATISASTSVGGVESYANGGWFRNSVSGTGLYNQVNGTAITSESANYWGVSSAASSTTGGMVFRAGIGGAVKGYLYWDAAGVGILNDSGQWGIRVNPNVSLGGSLLGAWNVTNGLNVAGSTTISGRTVYGPNTSYGTFLQVGGNGREFIGSSNTASVVTTNGNLHLDAASNAALYLNFYDGGTIYFGKTGGFGNWASTGLSILTPVAVPSLSATSISGGTASFSGTITSGGIFTTRIPTQFNTIAATAFDASIVIPEVTGLVAANTYFLPWIHGATTSAIGYRAHLSIGAYRPASGQGTWNGSGLYVGLGGNDLNPTEYFLLTFGGVINHSSGGIIAGGTLTSYGLITGQAGLTITGTTTLGATNTGALTATSALFGGNAALHAGNYASYAGGLTTVNAFSSTNSFASGIATGVSLTTANTSSQHWVGYSTGGVNAGAAAISFHRAGAYAINMGLDFDNIFRIGGWSAGRLLSLDMSGNMTIPGSMTATTLVGSLSGTASNATSLGGVAASNYALLASPTFTGTVTAPTFSGFFNGNTFSTYKVLSPDGDRDAGTKLPTTTPYAVRFDFVNGTTAGSPGSTYAGVMTYAPCVGNTASTGSQSYQLSFGSNIQNTGTIPVLGIRNGIDSTWNTWYSILHTGNYNNWVPSLTGGGASGTWGIGILGNAATATGLIGDQTNWLNYRAYSVSNMLGWNNYGNGHVIFDASKGLAPNGTVVNNTNAQVEWTPTYPSLMGWNGTYTYGVRVARARTAEGLAPTLLGNVPAGYIMQVGEVITSSFFAQGVSLPMNPNGGTYEIILSQDPVIYNSAGVIVLSIWPAWSAAGWNGNWVGQTILLPNSVSYTSAFTRYYLNGPSGGGASSGGQTLSGFHMSHTTPQITRCTINTNTRRKFMQAISGDLSYPNEYINLNTSVWMDSTTVWSSIGYIQFSVTAYNGWLQGDISIRRLS